MIINDASFFSHKKFLVAVFLIISITGFSQEICNNGIDDDGDGLIDLNDITDCSCNNPPPVVTSIIPNPSFEIKSACPDNISEMSLVTDWQPSCGTPDYFNTCGYVFPAMNTAGLNPFPDGNGIAGELFLQDDKENIRCCLSTPMLAGTSYKITFDIASTPINPLNLNLASGGIMYDPIDITIYGTANCSTIALNSYSTCPTSDPSWIQLGSVNYTPNMTWQNVSISFTPSVNINSIIVGAPCTLPASYPFNSSYIFSSDPPPPYFPYFYFDNFILNNSLVFGTSVNITSTGHFCTSDLMLIANLADTTALNSTLQWYHNGIAIVGATSNTLSIPSGTMGLGNYQVWLTAGAKCVLSKKYIVTSSAPVILVNSLSICPGSTTTLSASSACNSYTWSTGAITNSISVSPAIISNYTVTGSLGTCTAQAISKVSIFPSTLTVTGNRLICAGQTTTLTANGATYYSWLGNIPFSTIYNLPIVTLTPSITTTYTVYGSSGITPNTCTAQAVVTVSIAPSPTITVTPNNINICSGNAATLTASVVGANTYTWSNGATTSSINVFPATSTSYFVSSNIGSCISRATASVDIDPGFTFSVSSPTICSGKTAALAASGANSYTWASGSHSSNYTTLPLYNNTTFTVTGGNALNCKSIVTATVYVNHPRANFSGLNESVYTVANILQLTNQSSGASIYKWRLCEGILSANRNISLPLIDTGDCCITLIAYESLCVDSITKCFQVIPEPSISIPNVFTPNGDTKNDEFKINSVGLKSLSCTIFDRWGLKMYEWEGIKGFWDGNTKTGAAPSGTYFYIITYTDQKDKSTTEKGFLTLFKD
jgi:gliding motility-associated-like protein